MAESVSDERSRQIKELYQEMKLYKDPAQLEEVRNLIRKNVPLSMRGYLLAYLYVTSKNTAVRPAKKPEGARPQRPQIDDAVSLYVNIGKMSHCSPRDLAQFICDKSGLADSDILSVAFKQNYSFIYVRKDNAEHVIETVNGELFKGRKTKINYSKEKDEE